MKTWRWRFVLVVIAAVASASIAWTEGGTPAKRAPEGPGNFGRMFSSLPSYEPPESLLVALAASMQDPNAPADDNPNGTPSGFTYLGQFLDHDMTLDTTPLQFANVVDLLTNGRLPYLDLDSVYGGGPTGNPELYNASGRFKFSTPNGFEDLQRNPDGKAILVEGRNDENLVIAQFHIAVQKFHNKLIDAGNSFENAQRLTRFHWQWIVVHDFLPEVVGQATVDRFLSYNGAGKPRVHNEFYDPGKKVTPMMPIEFSVAAYRFGHSMVRLAYVMPTGSVTKTQVFNAAGNDLHGSRPIPPNLKIDFANFFNIEGVPTPPGRNISRKIDALISKSLFVLPVGPVIPDVPPTIVSLPERNLLRGKRLGLPSYQAVAQAMGITPLTNAELGLVDASPNESWGGEAPLWFGILKESEIREGGVRLGQTGGRIIAEVILTLIDVDEDSYFSVKGQAWHPAEGNNFHVDDFLRFAGAVPPLAPPPAPPEP